MFPKTVQKIIDKINCSAVIFFGAVLIIYGSRLAQMTMRSTLPATQWPAGTAYAIMPVGGIFIIYFALLDLLGLKKYRHLSIQGDKDDGAKTDQQILEEMRASKKEGKNV